LILNQIASTLIQPLWLIFIASLLSACSAEKTDNQLRGQTMGTSYSIQFNDISKEINLKTLQASIDQRLEQINQQMSTYLPTSELSRFNQSDPDEWYPVSEELALLVQQADSISKKSAGAFDITVGPLVNLWGFGPHESEFIVPAADQIKLSKQYIGHQYLRYQINPPALYKEIEGLYVDLSAIAKGYAVDELAKILDALHIENFMVEIGGEVKTRGIAAHGSAWRIGIETPAGERAGIEAIVSLPEVGVATSGDYRNYFEQAGKRYSHTIDPRSGYPVEHHLASVTVVHESVAYADGWATAFMVLGPSKTLEISRRLQLATLLITREGSQFKMTASNAMKQYLVD
jgi:thiamine biosynthesis lipoprotein